MNILLDTNILTRTIQPTSARFQSATDAVHLLHQRQERLCVVPQNLYEFWAVRTRPAGENALGLTTAETHDQLNRVRSLFTLLPDSPALFGEWEILVQRHDCKGKNTHDARLVAAMNNHALTAILTFNGRDFARYSAITVLTPDQVLAA